MTSPLHQKVLSTLVGLYDRRVMNNVHRAEYVECLVAEILSPDWNLPWRQGYDWAPWDLEHAPSGTRMEVKQSAALQPWHGGQGPPTPSPRFDIAPRTGYWTKESVWVDSPGRPAHIYVFAWHPETDATRADQRVPAQWRFFPVPTERLPTSQQSIGLAGLKRLASAVSFEMLSPATRAFLRNSQA